MSKRTHSRRDFLRLGLTGLGGTLLGMSSGTASAMMGHGRKGGMRGAGTGGMMRRTGSFIDPPAGGLFKDPLPMPDLSKKPGLVEISLEVGWRTVTVEGQQANLLTYNGQFPGPTIRVNRGDLLRVRFRNSMPRTGTFNMLGHERDLTNLHTHGLHVSPSGNSDNVHLQFQPGEIFTYEYDTSKQEAGTLCFYHPHIHGTVAEQYWAGLAGAFVIEDPDQSLAVYETHLLVLKDMEFLGSQPAPHGMHMDYMMGKEGSVIFVNGQVNPRLVTRPGQIQRWRIVNASNARFYNLSLENHMIHLIGTDGGLLDKPYPLTRILLSPGERVDILVKATDSSSYSRLLALPYDRGGHCHGNSQTVTLMTMVCEGNKVNDEIPATVNPGARRAAINPAGLPLRSMTLGMGRMEGYINGKVFGKDAFAIESKVGTYEIWDVFNASHMDHPFHQHVNAAQVLGIRSGDPEYAAIYSQVPAWKDTVIVPRMGGVRLLVPIMDFTGMSMMHCHILEHEDIGMMGMWHIA